MPKKFLGYLNQADDQLKRSLGQLRVSGIDGPLDKALSELAVFIHADLYHWFSTFLDSESIDAPVTRNFLATWRDMPRISFLALVKFFHLLEQESPQPDLLFNLARYARFDHSDVLGHLCLSGLSLGDMLAKFQRYYPLMFGGVDIQFRIDHQHLLVKWIMPPKLKEMNRSRRIVALASELCFAGLFGIMRNAVDHKGPLFSQVSLMGKEPADVARYRQFFECPVRFNADYFSFKIALPNMTLPLDLSPELLTLLIKKRQQAEMGWLPTILTDPFLYELQESILASLEDRSPNIGYVADKMAISRANLQRRLAERDLSFSTLLDQIRLNLAKLYLEQKKLSLTEIAWLLSFSDQTAFSRAFKRWVGMSPLDFRRLF